MNVKSLKRGQQMKKIVTAMVLTFTFSMAEAGTTDHSSSFRETDTGKGLLALSYYGADAQKTFDFLRSQSPHLYRITASGVWTFEHISGPDIFCAKDTQRTPRRIFRASQIVSQTFRCDINIGGSGRINPPLTYVGRDSFGGYDNGSDGGSGAGVGDVGGGGM
jgi:hypothetical protein